jgi:glycosyltransferase involved in cell wall biosynthesis
MTWLIQTYWINRISFTNVAEDLMSVLGDVEWERGDFITHTPYKPYEGVLYVGSFMNLDVSRYYRYMWWTNKHIYYGVMEGPPQLSPFNKFALNRMTVIVPSNYVKWELEQIGISVADVIPHGIDTEAFKNVPRDNEWRKIFGDKTVVLYVAHRHLRKGFKPLCEAWKKSKAGKDKNVVLVLHTSRKPNIISGEDYIIPEDSNIVVTDNILKLDRNSLMALYKSADLYIHGALAEGYGIPIAEAIAAGVPVLTLDAPPMNELNKVPEAKVKVDKKIIVYDFYGTAYRINIPDMDDYAEKIDSLVYDKKLRMEVAEKQSGSAPDISVYRRFMKWLKV